MIDIFSLNGIVWFQREGPAKVRLYPTVGREKVFEVEEGIVGLPLNMIGKGLVIKVQLYTGRKKIGLVKKDRESSLILPVVPP